MVEHFVYTEEAEVRFLHGPYFKMKKRVEKSDFLMILMAITSPFIFLSTINIPHFFSNLIYSSNF